MIAMIMCQFNIVLATDGKKTNGKDHVTCHRCGKKGHYAPECTAENPIVSKSKKAETKTFSAVTPCQTAKQMLMAGVESGEFDANETIAFQFINVDHDNESLSGVTLQSMGDNRQR